MAVLAAVVVVAISLMVAAFYSYVDRVSPIDPVAVALSFPRPKLQGVYARNTLLERAEKLGAGKLLMPEDLVLDPTGTFLYVGTADGCVKKLYLEDGSVEDWKRYYGRPLGLALGNDGEVIVCDARQGLLKLTDEGMEVLETEAEGTKFALTDAAVVSKDGLIYFTDASAKYNLENAILDTLEARPNGRIMVYDPEDRSTTVLLRDLYFPSGIALSKDEKFFVFTETTTARLVKYHIEEARSEVINDALPGFPDNVHYNQEKTILYVGIHEQRDAFIDLLWRSPFLKKVLALFPTLVAAAADGSSTMARVLALDEEGRPLKMYQDPKGKAVGFVTTGLEVDGFLYLGNLRDDYVGRIPV